jgi:hypothetical protein
MSLLETEHRDIQFPTLNTNIIEARTHDVGATLATLTFGF